MLATALVEAVYGPAGAGAPTGGDLVPQRLREERRAEVGQVNPPFQLLPEHRPVTVEYPFSRAANRIPHVHVQAGVTVERTVGGQVRHGDEKVADVAVAGQESRDELVHVEAVRLQKVRRAHRDHAVVELREDRRLEVRGEFPQRLETNRSVRRTVHGIRDRKMRPRSNAVQAGCIAARMQRGFCHGLLGRRPRSRGGCGRTWSRVPGQHAGGAYPCPGCGTRSSIEMAPTRWPMSFTTGRRLT